jgi:hypothetical protein
LFIEELTGIIPESRPSLVAWIYENIASNFHSQYIQEITVGDNSLWMSANGDIELDIAISLFPNALRRFIVADQSGVGEPEEASDLPDFSKSCLHLMCPLFDLLHACECRANAGNLEGIYLIFYDSWVIFEKEIDALLSCGILMDDVELKDIVGLEGPRKELICFAIYFAIQW